MRCIISLRGLTAAFLAVAGLLFQVPAFSDTDADTAKDAARIDTLLQRNGFKTDRKNDVVWAIDEQGKEFANYKVVVTTGSGLLVVFVILAHKDDMNMNEELAYKMLKMNHEFDRVKIGVDDDGDAFVRADTSVRVLDEVEMKEQIDQVAAAADEAYGDIKGYLKQ